MLATLTTACVAPSAKREPSALAPMQAAGHPYAASPATNVAPGERVRSANCQTPSVAAEGDYNLSGLVIFSRTLFYVRENHPRDVAPVARELLVKSLEAVALQERQILVERDVAIPPRWATITVAQEQCWLDIQRVDAPWSLRTKLQEAMRFVQAHLPPPPGGRSEERLMAIEVAATNGMLAALDGRSRLLDADTYFAYRSRTPKREGATPPEPAALGSDNSTDAPDRAPTALRTLSRVTPGSRVASLRLRDFVPGASAEVERALASLEREPPKGIIIDLRDNHGGILDEAVKVADAFIKEGVLGATATKRGRKDLVAHSDGHEPGGAVVVLVNRRTASASELVAAAIKNLGRGIILGEPTAGVASVDVVFDLPPKGRLSPSVLEGESLGLLLQTGRLLAAGGAEIAGAGVNPDIPLSPVGEAVRAENDCLLQFADAVINRARDAQRATLLATAKSLALPAACRSGATSRP